MESDNFKWMPEQNSWIGKDGCSQDMSTVDEHPVYMIVAKCKLSL